MLDPRRNPFERALDEARRNGRARGADEGSAPLARAYVRVSADLARTPGGGEARWGLAMDWAGEPPEPSGPPALIPGQSAHACTDTAAEIARELGVDRASTLAQLMALWRDFLWRNHPDRQPAQARERANARVAIANTLYERARRELTKAK
jgi:hypothetical protein